MQNRKPSYQDLQGTPQIHRLRFIEEYTRRTITIDKLDEFFEDTAESIIKTFEAEVSFVLVYGEEERRFVPLG